MADSQTDKYALTDENVEVWFVYNTLGVKTDLYILWFFISKTTLIRLSIAYKLWKELP